MSRRPPVSNRDKNGQSYHRPRADRPVGSAEASARLSAQLLSPARRCAPVAAPSPRAVASGRHTPPGGVTVTPTKSLPLISAWQK